jgi:hypothetical protein
MVRLLWALLPPGYMAAGYFGFPIFHDYLKWQLKQDMAAVIITVLLEGWCLLLFILALAPARFILTNVVRCVRLLRGR